MVRIRRILLLLVMLPLAMSSLVAQEKKNVLVISSYHPAFPTFERQRLGVKEGLIERGFDLTNMNLDYEFMDSKRFYQTENIENFTRSLTYKLSKLDQPYDLLLVSDDHALNFSLSHRNDLFRDTPVVFFGVNDVEHALSLDRDQQFTGVAETLDVNELLAAIQHIHPETDAVQVVVDGTLTGRAGYDLFSTTSHQAELGPVHHPSGTQLIFHDLTELSYAELAKKLAQHPTKPVVLYSAFVDSQGETKDLPQQARFARQYAHYPAYGFWDRLIGNGVLGGVIVNHYQQGRHASMMAGAILLGDQPNDFSVITDLPGDYRFDHALLEQYGLNEAVLPETTDWLNKTQTFREFDPFLYWLVIMFTTIGTLVIISLLGFLWIKHRMSVRLSRDFSLKSEELETAYQELLESEKMAALGRLVAGIAHEVNTPIGVGVTTTSHLQVLIESLSEHYQNGSLSKRQMEEFLTDSREGTGILMSSLSNAAQLISSFKQVAVDQSDEKHREINLLEYLNAVVLSLKPKLRLQSVDVDLTCDEVVMIETFPGALSQVVTNLIMNSLVHGFDGDQRKDQLKMINLHISATENGARILYRDNGKGMDEQTCQRVFEPFFTTKLGQGGSGLGLNIVYNLLKNQLKGSIHCESELNCGVTFDVTLSNIDVIESESVEPLMSGHDLSEEKPMQTALG